MIFVRDLTGWDIVDPEGSIFQILIFAGGR
jgi:hypothetical protein